MKRYYFKLVARILRLSTYFAQESQGYDNGRDLNDDDYEARKVLRLRAILGHFSFTNLLNQNDSYLQFCR